MALKLILETDLKPSQYHVPLFVIKAPFTGLRGRHSFAMPRKTF